VTSPGTLDAWHFPDRPTSWHDMSQAQQPDQARPSAFRLTRRGLLLMLLLFGLTAMSVYPLRQYVTQHQRAEQLATKQQVLAAEVERLERERARLQDPEYVEQLAREDLYMARPGEEAWVITGEPPSERPAPPAQQADPEGERSWYLRLWDKLTKRSG
jgi:cell division protein FtsB